MAWCTNKPLTGKSMQNSSTPGKAELKLMSDEVLGPISETHPSTRQEDAAHAIPMIRYRDEKPCWADPGNRGWPSMLKQLPPKNVTLPL